MSAHLLSYIIIGGADGFHLQDVSNLGVKSLSQQSTKPALQGMPLPQMVLLLSDMLLAQAGRLRHLLHACVWRVPRCRSAWSQQSQSRC